MFHPKYDVFLSFRGEDTRDNFTSHLHKELCRKNIDTFIDYRLERGDMISSALYKAIEESSVYVVILSEHYASSTWCLDELTQILEYKRSYGREVIPVFYKVDPSTVRHQRQSYADDFVKHQQRFAGKMDAWKAALTQVAGLSGWDSQVTRPESTLVTEIVEDVLRKLNRCFLSNYEGLIGIEKHIKQIQSLLLLESAPVRIIGIWGMGGVGKSTISSAIYRELITDFSSGSIIVNVNQEIERDGLDHVRRKCLSQILDQEGNTSSKFNFSFDPRLKRTKALLVLDDVKDSDQLKDLIGSHSNFGRGSRIIVTSRDKQVLKNANADEIYQVKEMDSQDSLQLFCLCAFKQNHPIESYASLSEKILDYAKGVPLALVVLGSLLYGKTKEAWESQLQKLKKLPDLKIFRLLKSSYDDLDDEQKNIFLDIACFYRGKYDKTVTQILNCCGLSAHIGMEVLKDRCLISISEGMIEMHDLIQEMGYEIVRLQCVEDPGKRSRLWIPRDIYDVLSKNKGTDAIQCIFLNLHGEKNVQLHAKTFKKMHNLRMIRFYNYWSLNDSNVTFHMLLKSLPDNLKYLHWGGFPQRSLPQDFCPENLVILDMPESDLKQLWEGDQALPNLKRLNLERSRELERLPDLSLSPNIQEVILSHCVSLVQVYSSSFLDDLYWLYLDGCTALRSLNIHSNILSRSSGVVSLNSCIKLETLLISSRTDVFQSYSCASFGGYFGSLYNPTSIEPMETWNYHGWDSRITDYDSYNFMHKFSVLSVSNCKSLTHLPDELFNLKFLERLNLSGCLRLMKLPEIKETMENLKVLILDMTLIEELPSSLHHLVALEQLSLQECRLLKTIPSSIGNLSKLRKTFPEIPSNIGDLSALTELSLQGTSMVNLPDSIAHLSCLKTLNLSGCSKLECIPKLPPKLNQLLAFNCPSIKRVVSNSRLKLLSNSKLGTFQFHLTNSQELDATSWSNIVAEAWFKISDDAYRSVFFSFTGSVVPSWLPYRCQGHSVTTKKDSPYLCGENRLIGFALCVVLGHVDINDTRPRGRSLTYKLGFESDGRTQFFHDDYIKNYFFWTGPDMFFNQDHTFLWKYQFDLASIGKWLLHAHSFTFQIQGEYFDAPCFHSTDVMVKECGICPLYTKQDDDDNDEEDKDDEEEEDDDDDDVIE